MVHNKYYKIGNFNKRIALLADIHYVNNYDLKIFNQIVSNLKENKPNFICISGDLVDDTKVTYDNCDKLLEFIKNISTIAPVIITIGNHDYTDFSKKQYKYIYNEKWFIKLNTIENVYYLNNKSLVRDNITFIGFDPGFEYYYSKIYEDKFKFISNIDNKLIIKPNSYNIMLCHSPVCPIENVVLENSNNMKKINLILSGHMHNGLVPKILDKRGNRGFVGAFRKFFPKYARGHVSKNINDKKINLIINGGVIKFSNISPKIFHKFNFLYPINIDYIDI